MNPHFCNCRFPHPVLALTLAVLLLAGVVPARAETRAAGLELPAGFYVRAAMDGLAAPTDLAERVWSAADRHFIYRLVLEMDDVSMLPSDLMGQLVMLQKRAVQHAGALRLSGLSEQCASALRVCRLDQALPSFPSREEAVVGVPRRRPLRREAFETSIGL